MKKLTKKILALLNLLAVLAIFFSYLANFVNPSKVALFAFFGLAYPYFLLINLFFLFLWAWRRNKLFFMSFFAIFIGFGNIGRYFQIRIPLKKPDIENSIKLLTYNVRVFNYYEWEKSLNVRDSIISYINAENVDIICLQEFLTRDNREQLTEDYIKTHLNESPYTHIDYSYQFTSGVSHFGVATFSKHPIVRKGKLVFERSFNTCIYSDIKINDDTIRVYNVHLQSIRLRKNNFTVLDSLLYLNTKRFDEVKDISGRLKLAFEYRAQQVNQVVRHMKESPYPVILCGDFNDTPVSYAYQKLIKDKKDAFRMAGAGIGNTYRGNLPSYRIDYIFYDSNFEALNYETGSINLSDHFPVTSHLRMADN